MTLDDVVTIMRSAFFTIIELASPVLLVSLIVGLIISIFQTVTSIQEQTLTFVPKILSIFLALMILGHWILSNIREFITTLWANFSQYLH